MFGIGGGELIFILLIVLMLFGSDKVPEIARTMGKAMAQLKNATNDIKSEIQKGAEANGLDRKTLTDLTGNITSEINSAKSNLLGNTNPFEDEFYVNSLKIPLDYVKGFKYYIVDNDNFLTILKSKNKTKIEFKMGELAIKYNEIISSANEK